MADVEQLRLFMEEWKYGWAARNALVQEANRLTMLQQLRALVEGDSRPPSVKPRD